MIETSFTVGGIYFLPFFYMKVVLIIRHAKSSWSDFSLPDFDRPLNDRGKKDAPEMAKRLISQNIPIDCFISSTAKRARKTAELFAKEFKTDKDDILFKPELYEASASVFSEIIANAPSQANTIAVFSHNPGITEFVNQLTPTRVDDMPTCAVFAVKAEITDWKEFSSAPKVFWFFDYPKNS